MRKSIMEKIMVLTLSSFIIKILGFVFRIYLSNIIGAEGMGLYQLVLSVYALGATISTFGITTAISRLVAVNEKSAKKILKTGIIITESLAFFVLLCVFYGAEYISEFFIKDSRATDSVRIVALSFPAISFFACLSGYFNGLTKVKYPVRGQITEQAVRIIFVVSLVKKAAVSGIENALTVTSVGILLGEYLSLLYLYIKYKTVAKYGGEKYTRKRFFGDILKISFPISLNSYFQAFLHTVESVIIPGRFVLYGYTHKQALSLLGMIKGMAMPLVFFPTVVLSSISTISLPHISKAQSKKDIEGIKRASNKSLFIAFITGIATMLVFFLYGAEICTIIYKNIEIAEVLKHLGMLVPMMYINIVAIGILNGLGKQMFLFITGTFEGIIKIVFISFLIPSYGFYGYVYSMVVCELILTVLYLIMIRKTVNVA